MQDQNSTTPTMVTPPSVSGAGVSDATMGIPNLTPPAAPSAVAPGAPTMPGAGASSGITNPTPTPTTGAGTGAGNDIATMGIPTLQPPVDKATPGGDNSNAKPTDGVSDSTKPNATGENKTDAKPKAPKAPSKVAQADMVKKIIEKIRSSENILIALSNNPSVDDIAAAIGLTLYLDGIQRHVTAIYSGRITEGLEFLQPEATFETNTDSLQDFIVALSKEKADHLRYKLEGDYVKVFITPYRAKITEDDLTFSHGEYNVDFVIALDVASPDELDAALEEHGRIMHSASTVNITTSAPGKFGEIDWSNPTASSVCEMVTQLILEMQGDDKPLDKDIATALLTGIVAATDRFSNSRTNSDTLGLASKLMSMGADQQLISANIKGNEISQEEPEQPNDNLMVDHAPEEMPDNTPTIVMPTVNTDISAVNPDLNSAAAPTPDTTVMSPLDVPSQPGIDNQFSAPVGVGTPSSSPEIGNSAVSPMADLAVNPVMNPNIPMPNNPAANLAGNMGADLGPDPAAMSIPSMVPQENLAPSPVQQAPQDNLNIDNLMPPVNGELADRPDSVLPPPPMPPVDQSSMAPPA